MTDAQHSDHYSADNSAQYTVAQYQSDLRRIVAEGPDDATIAERVKPLALRLASEPGWFDDRYLVTDPDQGFGMHLLFEEDNHDLAAFAIAWEPGRGLPPHNHRTWAVVAGIVGQEHETNYRRVDDGSTPGRAELEQADERTLHPGVAVSCLPDDIHSVWNNGQEVAVSLHTYGRHLNHTGRSVFDPEAGTETPLVVSVED